ncbi:hypothetical protein BaRGS_00022136 [Batillaria attramentaria]|uniref:Uncharacterized protein n=1 Tax=Batillaria attramentaria TaxID=370345 RepID=A0ABD0KHE7_9CAEN
MSMETLNSSVGSLVEESLFSDMDDEELLLRRLSPYATLRPGDLSSLMGIPHQTRGLSHIKAASVFADAIAERSDSDGESEKEDATEPEGEAVVVRGQDIGDLPAEYVVRGLRPHEMPVIGVYVDPRILPGFRYKVRHAGPGAQRYLFEGRAMTLQSIGLGYGKRLTFTGESLNFNDNYFWSDSDPNGFAFSLEAVREGDRLSIYGNNGSGVLERSRSRGRLVRRKKFLASNSKNTGIYIFVVHFFLQVVNGDVIKRVRVTMRCNVIYHHHSHGRVDYKLHDMETLTGEAVLVKKRGSRVAALDSVHNVYLSHCNHPCTLQVEP